MVERTLYFPVVCSAPRGNGLNRLSPRTITICTCRWISPSINWVNAMKTVPRRIKDCNQKFTKTCLSIVLWSMSGILETDVIGKIFNISLNLTPSARSQNVRPVISPLGHFRPNNFWYLVERTLYFPVVCSAPRGNGLERYPPHYYDLHMPLNLFN